MGAALAAAAVRAGWAFETYHDAFRAGRHFGGGDPSKARPGWAAGSLVAGGRHAEQVAWLAARYEVVALGDPASVLWPALEASGAAALTAGPDPSDVLIAAFARMEEALPVRCLVLDGQPQGRHGVCTAPYLYPELLDGSPALAVDVSSGAGTCASLEAAGVTSFEGRWVDAGRAARFPRALSSGTGAVGDRTYADVTAAVAAEHAGWGRGVLLGDPHLVGAQLGRAVRRRLLPLYGRPQVDAVERASTFLDGAEEPVWGRQYDDRDFFALARHGLSLQLVDPDPPFDAVAARRRPVRRRAAAPTAPSDDELHGWAVAGRVLSAPLFWCGMVRELDVLPRLVDVLVTTGVKAGVVVTTETVAHAPPGLLELLVTSPDRGGVAGQVELLLASTGRGVAPETLLPPGVLARNLASARAEVVEQLPEELAPRGWWPLLDAPLEPVADARVGWRTGVPVVWRGGAPVLDEGEAGEPGATAAAPSPSVAASLRRATRQAARAVGADRFLEERRPFHRFRPGPYDPAVAAAVKGAGFDHQWTKAAFGSPDVVHRDGDFVALAFTAGEWDGWTPFYTVGDARDVARAERRLVARRAPGWLVSTVDATLWAMSAEILDHGPRLVALARAFAGSDRLCNVLPGDVARYARIIEGTAGAPA